MFGFQEIPGLLTPEMQSNVNNSMLMGAAAALMKGAGPRSTPDFFGAFGEGLQGALSGYETGQSNALKQSLQREQIKKLADERALRERWESIFGVGSAAQMPAGIMSPQQPAAAAGSDPATPAPATTQQPPGLLSPQGQPGARPAIPTQNDVRTSAAGGIKQVLADMPPALRQMIGVMGPQKGMDTLATWVGKKAEKPSDTFLTVKMPDGSTKSHRADSPALDAAIQNGGMIVTTPSSQRETELVSLRGVDGVVRSYRKDDPAIDSVLAAGGTQVTTPSSNPNDHTKKPDAYLLPNGKTVLSVDGQTYEDEGGVKQRIPQTGTIKLGADTAYDASRSAKVESRAQADLDARRAAPGDRPPAEGPTAQGTGPYSALKGAADAVLGGLGVDKAIGQNGIFPQTTANRQYLLNLRQVGKTALVNNPRFPVAEQKNVDELFPNPEAFWTNPNSEAQKIPIMRNMLNENLTANNEAIAGGGLTKEERSKLTSNNIEIKRALRLLGEGDASLDALNPSPTTQAATSAAGGSDAWSRVKPNQIVLQGGKKYRKREDGSAELLP